MESSNFDSCSCSNTKNNMINCQNYTKIHSMIRWKSGKRVDPRILGLLESFGEIYVGRRDFFRKVFHGDHEELFEKIGDALKRKKEMKKARSVPRSSSMRAIGKREVDQIDELRLERLNNKTSNVIVARSGGTSRGGQIQPTQSLKHKGFKIKYANVTVVELDDTSQGSQAQPIQSLGHDRFKIRPPNVIVAGSDDTSQRGHSKPTQSFSNDSK